MENEPIKVPDSSAWERINAEALANLREADPALVDRAVAKLQATLTKDDVEALRELHEGNPATWWAQYGWHFHGGMSVRNVLREAVADAELPSGNWDDFYVPVLEVALGVRS